MKRIYAFGGGTAEGSASMKNLLGGKGANLAEMSSLGLPVPPGFTITTQCCVEYLENQALPNRLMAEITAAVSGTEKDMGKLFGDADNPLLLSVRSGARVSMPGMMDTVLNLGLNDTTVKGLARGGDERFAWDSYRRFVTMYADVVLGLNRHDFEHLYESLKTEKGFTDDTQLDADDWKLVVGQMKALAAEQLGRAWPDDPMEQLAGAVEAVFRSWNTPRAVFYRNSNGFAHDWGTAVNVQAMVFGNAGDDCATGVAFTRDPSNGAAIFYGEYLINAQGEDVVAGTRTPQPLNRLNEATADSVTLEEAMPRAYAELVEIHTRLEQHYKDMQDLEFTIENDRLFILQTRTGKRTGAAAVRIAVDMVNEGLVDKAEAIQRIEEGHLTQLLHPRVDDDAPKTVIATGLAASPGAAVGKVVFSADEAVRMTDAGETVVLVREETSPEDIHGMDVAAGILTQRGGATSHAAVVARGMGRCCVAGCADIAVHGDSHFVARGEVTVKAGDVITLNGTTGEVMLGAMPLVDSSLADSGLDAVLEWADELARMTVRANADTPKDAHIAREFGATGIGLCRTEHMFFDGDRITAVREMILAEDAESRVGALEKLYPMQRSDFVGILTAMEGLPVTIRLLDPPLHEFLPHEDDDRKVVADAMGLPLEKIVERCEALKEFNPMMGHRGCRLGITHPEIYAMQVRAILDAALDVQEAGHDPRPEIMIPLVGHQRELEVLRALTMKTAEEVFERRGKRIDFLCGTMIELPRAALTADRIAQYADFFSFGTNDLTQTTFGYSRDDASFLKEYVGQDILPIDPFVAIDADGVGVLVRTGTELGRKTKPGLKVGICGEHGGNPDSIGFVHGVGLDYVSCSPFRVPVARLAAGQAAVK